MILLLNIFMLLYVTTWCICVAFGFVEVGVGKITIRIMDDDKWFQMCDSEAYKLACELGK